MKSIQLKIREFLADYQFINNDLDRKRAATKLYELFDRELQKQTPKKTLLIRIEQYKKVLKLAKVPKIIIENPSFIQSMPLTKQDIELAKKRISEYEEWKKFKKVNENKL